MERRRRPGDAEASSAGGLLPHMLDHLEAPEHLFERLGDVFAQLAQMAMPPTDSGVAPATASKRHQP
jgi:hypothetical protein